MESLRIIEQLEYGICDINGKIRITEKHLPDPLTCSHDGCTDTDIHTARDGKVIKISSFGDVEADIGYGMRIKAEKECKNVKVLIGSTVIFTVDFRDNHGLVSERDFDITVDKPFSRDGDRDMIYTVDANGLLLKERQRAVSIRFDERSDDFLRHMIININNRLSLLCGKNTAAASALVYRSLEAMVKSRLEQLVKSGDIDRYKAKRIASQKAMRSVRKKQ